MYLLFPITNELLTYHTIALVSAVFLDLLLGDPRWFFHPIRLIGSLISALEKRLLDPDKRDVKKEIRNGIFLVFLVILISVIPVILIMFFTYRINRILGIVTEVILTFYMLAARSLFDESMKVSKDIKKGDLIRAKEDLSMIVGRDTDRLEEEGVIRAAVETVAENTSDGVIAPLLYAIIGGPVAAFLYKAVNTMDSMVGYKNEKYEYFGKAAAKTDDVLNFIPSRISALLMIASSFICRLFSDKYSGIKAFKIWIRDRRKHTSPNSAQTESVCAGALGILLGGPSYYGGILKEKPFLGDDKRAIENEDIKRANVLMFLSEFLLLAIYL